MPKKPTTGRASEAKWIESRKRWQINTQLDGERRTFTDSTPGKKGKAAAEALADDWRKNRQQRQHIRLIKLWEEFLENEKILHSEKNYIKHEQMGRLWILPMHQHKQVQAITVQDWQECILAAYKKGKSKKTCQNIRGSITAFYEFARRCRIPMEAPEGLLIPKDAPVRKKNIMQSADLNTLFSVDWIKRHNRVEQCFEIHAWRFVLLSGVRRAELCALRKTDIENDMLHVHGTKTEAADRYMMLTKRMRKVLADQLKMLKAAGMVSPFLFPAADGYAMTPDHLGKTWKAYRKQHGIKSTLHELRHTLVSVSKSDMPEELLKLVIGHTAKTDTFGIYGHAVEGDLERAAEIFDEIFDRLLEG